MPRECDVLLAHNFPACIRAAASCNPSNATAVSGSLTSGVTSLPLNAVMPAVQGGSSDTSLRLRPTVVLAVLQEWFADNEFWLVPYAAFCFLRDLFGTAEHWRWGAMATPTPQVRCMRLGGPY